MVSRVSDDQGAPALRAPRLLLPHHTDSPPSRVVADHLTIVIPEYMLRLLQRPHNARYVDWNIKTILKKFHFQFCSFAHNTQHDRFLSYILYLMLLVRSIYQVLPWYWWCCPLVQEVSQEEEWWPWSDHWSQGTWHHWSRDWPLWSWLEQCWPDTHSCPGHHHSHSWSPAGGHCGHDQCWLNTWSQLRTCGHQQSGSEAKINSH